MKITVHIELEDGFTDDQIDALRRYLIHTARREQIRMLQDVALWREKREATSQDTRDTPIAPQNGAQ